eukprot:CAMPEP_0203857284 /NCGR_PEP_ID=MMETSP0359-20131031/10644_1 /ASSEMBLY_ACC=CAM_ASM_000338 /TAXON_ID=268821 /ORGANISM="Scrippsiella Hangoei, Strain SHTV-5" /LENGTH=1067 /DNA_ID=CAMNT_0050773969 /DNA_START=92 /DNA_END=3295 /DNA_ORIENTATION=-
MVEALKPRVAPLLVRHIGDSSGLALDSCSSGSCSTRSGSGNCSWDAARELHTLREVSARSRTEEAAVLRRGAEEMERCMLRRQSDESLALESVLLNFQEAFELCMDRQHRQWDCQHKQSCERLDALEHLPGEFSQEARRVAEEVVLCLEDRLIEAFCEQDARDLKPKSESNGECSDRIRRLGADIRAASKAKMEILAGSMSSELSELRSQLVEDGTELQLLSERLATTEAGLQDASAIADMVRGKVMPCIQELGRNIESTKQCCKSEVEASTSTLRVDLSKVEACWRQEASDLSTTMAAKIAGIEGDLLSRQEASELSVGLASLQSVFSDLGSRTSSLEEQLDARLLCAESRAAEAVAASSAALEGKIASYSASSSKELESMHERLRGELDLVSSARIADLLTEFQDAMQCSAESSATGLEAVKESLQTEAALLSEALRNEVAVAASASMARITTLSASLQDLVCSSDLENFSSSLHGKIAILEDRMDAQQASASEAIEALGASSAKVATALRVTIQEEVGLAESTLAEIVAAVRADLDDNITSQASASSKVLETLHEELLRDICHSEAKWRPQAREMALELQELRSEVGLAESTLAEIVAGARADLDDNIISQASASSKALETLHEELLRDICHSEAKWRPQAREMALELQELRSEALASSSELRSASVECTQSLSSVSKTCELLARDVSLLQQQGLSHDWCIERCLQRVEYLSLDAGTWLDSTEFMLGCLGRSMLRLYPRGVKGGDGQCAVGLFVALSPEELRAVPLQLELYIAGFRRRAVSCDESGGTLYLASGYGKLESYVHDAQDLSVGVEVPFRPWAAPLCIDVPRRAAVQTGSPDLETSPRAEVGEVVRVPVDLLWAVRRTAEAEVTPQQRTVDSVNTSACLRGVSGFGAACHGSSSSSDGRRGDMAVVKPSLPTAPSLLTSRPLDIGMPRARLDLDPSSGSHFSPETPPAVPRPKGVAAARSARLFQSCSSSVAESPARPGWAVFGCQATTASAGPSSAVGDEFECASSRAGDFGSQASVAGEALVRQAKLSSATPWQGVGERRHPRNPFDEADDMLAR